VLVVALAAGLSLGYVASQGAGQAQTKAPGATRCEVDAPKPSPSPSPSPEAPITLTAKASGFYFDLGNDRGEQVRTIDVEASRTLPPDQELCVTIVGDLLTADAHGSLGTSGVAVQAAIDPRNPRLIQVRVTLTPDNDDKLGPFRSGSYASTVRLAGVGLEKVDIPIALTLRSGPGSWGPILAIATIVLGLAIGSLARWRSKQGQAAAEEHKDAKKQALGGKTGPGVVLTWAWWRTTGSRVILGVATAAGVALIGWSTQFLDKLTFGTAGFTDWLALALWGFAAGYAGKTTADYLPTPPPPPAVVGAPAGAVGGPVGGAPGGDGPPAGGGPPGVGGPGPGGGD